jgi:chromosome segregation ATPase
MEKVVTLEKVQEAINQLRSRGEKVSRRNVLAITGGGMGTVHQLMAQAEELEARESEGHPEGISMALRNAIFTEIGGQVEAATRALAEQVTKMRDREAEAYQSLAESEAKAQSLTLALAALKEESDQQRKMADTASALATEKIAQLEKAVTDLQIENKRLSMAGEDARLETVKARTQTEHAHIDLRKAETKISQLAAELDELRKSLADAEKREAVAEQRVQDLTEALAAYRAP